MNCAPANSVRMARWITRAATCLALIAAAAARAANWESSVTAGPPGPFPPARPLVATYRFGWSGLQPRQVKCTLPGKRLTALNSKEPGTRRDLCAPFGKWM